MWRSSRPNTWTRVRARTAMSPPRKGFGMTTADLVSVASDNAVTRRERHRQSRYRELVLGLPAGQDARRRTLGNYLSPDEWRHNFLSEEAAEYARSRADEVSREGGQLEKNRLFTN